MQFRFFTHIGGNRRGAWLEGPSLPKVCQVPYFFNHVESKPPSYLC